MRYGCYVVFHAVVGSILKTGSLPGHRQTKIARRLKRFRRKKKALVLVIIRESETKLIDGSSSAIHTVSEIVESRQRAKLGLISIISSALPFLFRSFCFNVPFFFRAVRNWYMFSQVPVTLNLCSRKSFMQQCIRDLLLIQFGLN